MGIQIHGAFILGLPGETSQTIEESIRFAGSLDVDTIQVSLATPYPGTRFYEICQENHYFRKLSRGSLPGKKSVPVPGSPMQDSPEVPGSEQVRSGTHFFPLKPGLESFLYFASMGMVDEGGYQVCPVSYPGLTGPEIFRVVERFYRRFYSRPRFLLSTVKKMIFDQSERKRLLQEGAEFRQFLKRRRKFYIS